MRYMITGATGFTGARAAAKLIAAYGPATCLVRAGSDRSVLPRRGVAFRVGDLRDPDSLADPLAGMDVLVNIASMTPGWTPGIVRACERAGVRRAIFLGSTALFTAIGARSKAVRLAGERAVRESSLHWTILRATMIYGTPRDRNMWRLLRALRTLPVLPIFGEGRHLHQPVHVDDVADAIVACLRTDRTIGRCYNLSGAEPLTYNQLIETACRAAGRRPLIVHVPYRLSLWLVAVLRHLPLVGSLKVEQVRRLNEDKAFDHSAAAADFGFRPRSFGEGIASEAAYLRRAYPQAASRVAWAGDVES